MPAFCCVTSPKTSTAHIITPNPTTNIIHNREYLLADALGHAPSTLVPLAYPAPAADKNEHDDAAATAAFAPLLPPVPQAPLTARGVAHFAACCIYLAKRWGLVFGFVDAGGERMCGWSRHARTHISRGSICGSGRSPLLTDHNTTIDN